LFQTFEEYIKNPKEKIVILRHDVDRKPGNSLVVAKIEKEAGIKASYYFRIVKESYDEDVIKQIAEMGHEIGYHYENLAEVSKNDPHPRGIRSAVTSEFHRAGITQINAERKRRISHQTPLCELRTAGRPTPNSALRATHGRQTHTDIYPADPPDKKVSSLREKKEFRDKFFELAIDDFRLNLEKFRKIYPVKTICMHGSPLSKWDNRDLWKKYDYRDYGIIAEPYFDLDFKDVFYITDTGRRWNGDKVSVRDKVEGTGVSLREDQKVRRSEGEKIKDKRQGTKVKDLRFRYTWDIIKAAEKGLLPDKIMLNTHPQRWTDNPVEWTKELVWQNFKNVIKKYFYVRK
jgi:hypothetical protein